ncbi:MAG: flagellar hook capping FlgD N-terminal domain-containing protein [Actinomycetaceae bacterium]|nr:flagellar hook capping FlgD N-terminal domain-containing protein [Actinomycetaceae bacterium]
MPVETATASAPAAGSAAANLIKSMNAAKEEGKATVTMTDEEREAALLKAVNEGQRTDKVQKSADERGKLGKDDFMKLMIATLKYQDPNNAMDTQALLEQTTTMASMEQMAAMTESMQNVFQAQMKMQGTALVGQQVIFNVTDKEGNVATAAGKVDAIEYPTKGQPILHVAGGKIALDKILGVADGDAAAEDALEGVKDAAKKAEEAGEAKDKAKAEGEKDAKLAEAQDALRAANEAINDTLINMGQDDPKDTQGSTSNQAATPGGLASDRTTEGIMAAGARSAGL